MSRSGPRLSLIEAALLLCVIGIVLVVFVPTFLRRVRTNKINEAAELLQEMSDRAAAYYATPWDDAKRFCLPGRAGPSPEAPAMDLQDLDFGAEEHLGHESWAALGFQPARPVRYSYSFTPSHDGCGLNELGETVSVTFRADGDLDGDGVNSRFERRASIDGDGFQPGVALHVHRRVE